MLEERNVRKGFLPDEAYIRLAEATAKEQTARLRPWLRGMFEAASCYGWRESEVTNLKVHQFDPSARIVLLEPGETKNDVPRQTPPMDETIYQLILACTIGKGSEDFIFTRDDGEPIRDFRGAWWKARVVAGRGKFVCKECHQIMTEAKCESRGGEGEYRGGIRRTAVPCSPANWDKEYDPQWHPRESRDGDLGAQDAQRIRPIQHHQLCGPC
jgi:hypothetical protein